MFNFFHPRPVSDGRAVAVKVVQQKASAQLDTRILIVEEREPASIEPARSDEAFQKWRSPAEPMTISKGDFIKLVRVDAAKALYVDWLSSRKPAAGDIALVEDVFETEMGPGVRLLCEPCPGFIEWRVDMHVSQFAHAPIVDAGEA